MEKQKPLSFDALTTTLAVSHETAGRLKAYGDLLVKWQQAVNLVAGSTLPDLWRRHFLDAGQLYPLLPPAGGPVVDLGSGAGFPGMVLAVMGVPEVHLVESDLKKASFLREVARQTATPVTIHAKRIEEVAIPAPALVTARALAPLAALVGWQKHLGASQGLYLKGAKATQEVAEASLLHRFESALLPSQSGPEGRIVRVTLVSHETQN